MKLLASYNLTEARKDKTISPVEVWRVHNPIMELKKHTDWTIDETTGIFPEAKKAKEVTEEEMQSRIDYFSKYDLVWGSYYTNPFIHAFTMVAQEKIDTRFVMDCDDNIFAIDPLNPIHVAIDKKYLEFLKGIAIDYRYITTTTEPLAEVLREMRTYRPKDSVVVIPNLISTKNYHNPGYDNGDEVVIGYTGGSSHYADLHNTNMAEALKDIMHQYKNVRVKFVGMYLDRYLPKARYEYMDGKRGHKEWYKLFSELNFDIGLAPLEDTPFTRCKSNIKWQEYSLMNAAFLGSNNGPYKDTVKHGTDGWLVDNTYDSWYNGFKVLVENAILRKKIRDNAKKRVIEEFSLEKNYKKVEEGLEKIAKLKKV